MKRLQMMIGGVILILAGCTSASIASFEATAAPKLVQACQVFRTAEQNPAVVTAVSAGSAAVSLTTGLPAGLAVSSIKSFGDQFCANGPPAGDTTTVAQQATWLQQQVTQQMLSAAGAK